MVAKEKALCNRTIKLEPERLPKIKLNPPSLVSLEELLHDIYVVGRPEPNDYDLRRNLVRVFNVMAKEVYGNSNPAVVEAFGSFLMDMFSVHSDLDLSINFSNEPVDLPRDKKIKALRKFSKKLYLLQSKGHVSGVAPIMSAKVPVLKVVDRGSGIECDISVGNKDGILKSQIISIVSLIDERFQKLSLLMKAWARAYGINSSKDGTLNSLSIILLVAFHLQTRELPILPPFSALLKDGNDTASVGKVAQAYLHYGKENKESLAELFATLLAKLVSFEFLWPKGHCVSTYEGSWISKTGKYKGGINVEDFTDRSQNVARAVKAGGMKVIYKCIHSSFHHLSVFMDGQIEASKLKTLLFSSEPIPFPDKKFKNVKRSFPSHDTASTTPLNPVMRKKARHSEVWSSQKHPSVISGFVLGSQQELHSGSKEPNQSVQDGAWRSQNLGVQTGGGSSWEGDKKYGGIRHHSALKASHSSPFVNPAFAPALKQENFTGFGQQEVLWQNGVQGAGNWGNEQTGGWGRNGTHGVENLGEVQTGGRSSWGGDPTYGGIQNHSALKAPNGSPFVNPGFVPVIKQEIYSRLGQQEELLQNGGQGAGNPGKQQTGGWGWGREGTHGAENFQKAPFVNPQSCHGFQQGPPGEWSSQDWGRDQTGGSGWQRDQTHGVENLHRPPFIPPAFGHGFQQRPCLEEQNRAGWNERWGSQEWRRDQAHGAENLQRPPVIPEFRPWFPQRPL